MTDHKLHRADVLDYLRYELVGPWESWDDSSQVMAKGVELDVKDIISFPDK